MNEKLHNYERVTDIDEVLINTHVRYVTLDKDKKQVFRLGGFLIRNTPKYVQLSNGNVKWSVQKYHYDDPVNSITGGSDSIASDTQSNQMDSIDNSENSEYSEEPEPIFETIFLIILST